MILLDELEDDLSLPAKALDRSGASSSAPRPGTPQSFASATTLNSPPEYAPPLVSAYPPEQSTRTLGRAVAATSLWEKWELRLGLKAKRRIGKVVLRTLVVYFVLSIVIVAIALPLTLKQRSRNIKSAEYQAILKGTNFYANSSLSNYLSSDDITSTVSCGKWTAQGLVNSSSHLYASSLQYRYPIKNGLFVRADLYGATYDNPLAVGTLRIIMNSDESINDVIWNVTVLHSKYGRIASTTACLKNTLTGDVGLALSPAIYDQSTEPMQFFVEVFLPSRKKSSYVARLVTELPLFNQQIGNLSKFEFGEVTLAGPISPIFVDYIRAENVAIANDLGEVRGMFDASSTLAIYTRGAPVVAAVKLINNGSSEVPLTMDISNENGIVGVSLTLDDSEVPQDVAQLTPSFEAQVITSSSSISLNVTHTSCTPRIPLDLVVQGSLSDVDVALDSTFAGTFEVASMLGSVSVVQEDHACCNNTAQTLQYAGVSSTSITGWVEQDGSLQPGQDSIRATTSFRSLVMRVG